MSRTGHDAPPVDDLASTGTVPPLATSDLAPADIAPTDATATDTTATDAARADDDAGSGTPGGGGLFGRGLLYVVVWALQLVASSLVSPILAHVLGPTQFGALASAIALYQVLSVLAVIGLDQAIVLQRAEDGHDRVARGLLTIAILVSFGATAVVLAFAPLWQDVLGFSDSHLLVIAVVLWTAPSGAVQVMLALLLAQDRLRVFSIVSVISAVGGSFVGLVLLGTVHNDATTYAWGGVVCQFAAMAVGLAVTRPSLRDLPGRAAIGRAIRFGVPLALGNLAYFVLNAGDRIVLQRLLGSAAVGRYQVAYVVGSAVILLLTFTNQAWTPQFAKLRDDVARWELAMRSRNALYGLLVPIVLAVTLVSPFALPILAPASFHPEQLSIVVFLVALTAYPVAASGATGRLLVVHRRTVALGVTASIGAVVNVALNFVLVPHIGIAGSAVATTVSYAVVAGIQLAVLPRRPAWRGAPIGLVLMILLSLAAAAASLLPPQTLAWNTARLVAALACLPWFLVRLRAARRGAHEPAADRAIPQTPHTALDGAVVPAPSSEETIDAPIPPAPPVDGRRPMTATIDARAVPRLRVGTPAGASTAGLVVAVISLAAIATIVADAPVWLRAPLVLVAAVTAPGLPIVRLLRIRDRAARAALVLVLSVVVDTGVALGMLWTHTWAPDVGVAVLLAVTVVLAVGERILLVRLAPRAAETTATTGDVRTSSATATPAAAADADVLRRSGALVGGLVVATVLWVLALTGTDTSDLGQWGLLPAFPISWYVAVAVSLAVAVIAILDTRVHTVVRALSLGLVVLVVTASADLLESAARPPWVFKHIAVTSYIDQHGSVDAAIDIYNRWPGFFAASAFLGHAAGHLDALDYARFTSLAVGLLDAALVLAIARAVGVRGRWGWVAALTFTVTNWVGQNYYSPQAFAFTLYLAMVFVVLSVLRGRPIRVVERLATALGDPFLPARDRRRDLRRRGRAFLRTTGGTEDAVPRSRIVAAVIVVLLLQAAISASHQLTPFIAVASLAPLFLVGVVRPRWLAVPLVLLPVLFLLPNLGYVQSHFGLFSSFDPVANLTTGSTTIVAPTLASALQSRGVLLLTGIVGVLALCGLVRNLRRGHALTSFVVLWLAVAPGSTLFGQTYGGEAKFRVVLFALPFLAIGVSWLFRPAPRVDRAPVTDPADASVTTTGRAAFGADDRWHTVGASAARSRTGAPVADGPLRRRAVIGLVAALAVLSGLFVATTYQPEASNRTPPAAVQAGRWLDHHFTAKDTLFTSGNVPSIIGGNYEHFLQRYGQTSSLAEQSVYFPKGMTPADVGKLAVQYSAGGSTWFAFSSIDPSSVGVNGALTRSQVGAIQRYIASVAVERYDRGGIRIYELSRSATTAGTAG